MIRVLLADDDERYLRTLQAFLGMHDDIEIVGCASSGSEAVHMEDLLRPDITVMDVFMENVDGITATGAIVRRNPLASVLMLTAGDDFNLRQRSRQVGAAGFITKGEAVARLVPELRQIVEARGRRAELT